MLKGMVALITGSAGSLGSATAKRLAGEGMKVVLLDLPTSKGQALAEELGEAAAFSPGDITSEKDVQKVLELAKNKFKHLDVIVNCAGTFTAKAVFNFNQNLSMTMDTADECLRTNLLGTINVVRLGVGMIGQNNPDQNGLRGLVVNTAGFAATDGQMGQVMMSAVWGGIASMTMPLCRELGSMGIRVVTISPGLIKSRIMDILPLKVLDHLSVVTPSPKRLGYPEEYASLVSSIISNPFINGEVIRLDGGLRFSLS